MGLLWGLLNELLLISLTQWLETHHFWRMLNSVIYGVSAIHYNVFSFSLHCEKVVFLPEYAGGPLLSLNQFRTLNFLCKIDFHSIFTSRALHFLNLLRHCGGEYEQLEVERAHV